jgi:hypothetical protein
MPKADRFEFRFTQVEKHDSIDVAIAGGVGTNAAAEPMSNI